MANNQSLQLSATELKAMTKWPDALIYEFLSLQSSVQEITQNITIVINSADQAISSNSQTDARLNALRDFVLNLQNQLAALDAIPARLVGLARSQGGLILDLNEQLSSVSGTANHLQAKLTAANDTIASLTEQVAAPNYTLLARLNADIDSRLNLQQEMAGA